jgi:hypothetical protein
MLDESQFARLERRMMAVTCDAVAVGVCCLAMYLAGSLHWLWNAGLVALVVLAGVECFTGISPGKWLLGWSVCIEGERWPRLRLALRGLTRYLPVAVFVFAIFGMRHFGTRLALFAIVGMLATVYFSQSYLAVMRRERTFFDLVAGTRLQASSEGTPA